MDIFSKRPARKGFIQAIILIVIALIVLGYFKIDIKTVLAGPIVQENLKYAWQLVQDGLSQVASMGLQSIQSRIHGGS